MSDSLKTAYQAGAKPLIDLKHIDGPLLTLRDGRVHWLTPWERFLVRTGRADAYTLERKYWVGPRKRIPLLCNLLGHSWDPIAAAYMWYRCERCGQEAYITNTWYDRIRVKLWILEQYLGARLMRARWWVRDHVRCEYCGGWFGRHDERQDHLPF